VYPLSAYFRTKAAADSRPAWSLSKLNTNSLIELCLFKKKGITAPEVPDNDRRLSRSCPMAGKHLSYIYGFFTVNNKGKTKKALH